MIRKVVIKRCACLAIVLAACVAFAAAQHKIVMAKGLKRAVLYKGLRMMPLFKKDTVSYSWWRSSATPLTKPARDSIWEVDSIGQDGQLVLKRIAEYDHDTVPPDLYKKDKALRKELRKNWKLDTIVMDSLYRKIYAVYRKPKRFQRVQIALEDLRAVRFPKNFNADMEMRRALRECVVVGSVGTALSVYAVFVLSPGSHLLAFPAGIIVTAWSVIRLNELKVRTYELDKWKLRVKKVHQRSLGG